MHAVFFVFLEGLIFLPPSLNWFPSSELSNPNPPDNPVNLPKDLVHFFFSNYTILYIIYNST